MYKNNSKSGNNSMNKTTSARKDSKNSKKRLQKYYSK